MTDSIPYIGFCAASGTGKTSLIAQLIPLLKQAGLRIAVIKHGHHSIDLDTPGKDTHQFRQAGAKHVVLSSNKTLAVMTDHTDDNREPDLSHALSLIPEQQIDLILVEGFKHAPYPKIELNRQAISQDYLFLQDARIIALASDNLAHLPSKDIPDTLTPLDLNDTPAISQFIIDWLAEQKQTTQSIQTTPKNSSNTMSIRNSPSCADRYDPNSLPVDIAKQRILAAITPVKLSIKQHLHHALGKVLAEPIVSSLNVPGHTNSAMDGYALRGQDLPQNGIEPFTIIDTTLAGQQSQSTCKSGECVRIMTGATMPDGADTVVMQEQTELAEDGRVLIASGHKVGQNVRQAGEDIAIGQTVLQVGHRLQAADLGLLASLGIAEVRVYRQPRVAFFSTGDELRSIGQPLDKGCIYDSNRYTLYGMLAEAGVDIYDMGVVKDDPEALEHAFAEASRQADMVITSGGVSVGEADYIKTILDKRGQINFWKIATKPGRPLAFGKLDEALFFGLPGNPVAVMVTFNQFVLPALAKLAGEQEKQPLRVKATCQCTIRKRPGRTEYLRAVMSYTDQGDIQVDRTGSQGSGILTSMSRANCLIVLAEEQDNVAIGDQVMVQPLSLVL